MSFKKLWLIPAILYFVISCAENARVPQLSQQERSAIDSLGVDTLLILEVKKVTGKEFIKMPGAVQALKEHKLFPYIHGVQVGFFEVDMKFDELPLIAINKKWNPQGYSVYTVKYKGKNSNRLMIKVF